MLPIGPLMKEHRWIERMVAVMKIAADTMRSENRIDPEFVDVAVDFYKNYADRCHHGKEEDILFRQLAEKPLSEEHRRIMGELTEEHVTGRGLVGQLLLEKQRYLNGNKAGLDGAIRCIRSLIEFYPKHIEKEDKHFFLPVMDYMSKVEQDAMLQAFFEFDKKLIHEKYAEVVEKLEKKSPH